MHLILSIPYNFFFTSIFISQLLLILNNESVGLAQHIKMVDYYCRYVKGKLFKQHKEHIM